MWERTHEGDKRRSEEDRKKCLHHIAASKEWIVEGVHYTWVNESFNEADLIIFLDTHYLKRIWFIIKRYVLQKAKIEKRIMHPHFLFLLTCFSGIQISKSKADLKFCIFFVRHITINS